MAQALEEQRRQPDLDGFGFEERLALLVEREATGREDRRLRSRLKFAGMRQSASVEDIDWRAARGLDRAVFAWAIRPASSRRGKSSAGGL